MQIKPKNGHVLFAECQDPANLIAESGIEIANLGYQGQTIGVVLAVDESPVFDSDGNEKSRPHICKAGDVIYCKDPDVTGVCKLDGGKTVYSVRECLIWAVATGVSAEELPLNAPSKSHFDAVIDGQRARRAAREAAKNIALPSRKIEIVH